MYYDLMRGKKRMQLHLIGDVAELTANLVKRGYVVMGVAPFVFKG